MKTIVAIPALVVLLFAGVVSAQSYYYPYQSYSYSYGTPSYYNYNSSYYGNSSYYPYYGSSYYNYSYPSYSNYGYNYDEPEIEEVDGPGDLEEGERGVWRVEIDAAYGSYVTVSVDWDDDNCYNTYNPYNYYNNYSYGYNYNYGYNYGCDGHTTQSFYVTGNRTLTFAHTYFDEDTYDVRFTVRGMYGGTDTATDRVRVDDDGNDDDDDDLTIEVISGPSSLEEDEEGTWKVRVESDDNDSYTVTADWDDNGSDDKKTGKGDKTFTFEHEYDDEGDYDIEFRVSGGGDSDTDTTDVEVED